MGHWFESSAAHECLLRLVVRTTGFHPVNASSILAGDVWQRRAAVSFSVVGNFSVVYSFLSLYYSDIEVLPFRKALFRHTGP